MMQRCNHLHGKKGDLDEVKVLAPQQTMHVMEDIKTFELKLQWYMCTCGSFSVIILCALKIPTRTYNDAKV